MKRGNDFYHLFSILIQNNQKKAIYLFIDLFFNYILILRREPIEYVSRRILLYVLYNLNYIIKEMF